MTNQKKMNTIKTLEKENEEEICDIHEIGEVAAKYFENLFHSIRIGDLSPSFLGG